jgi:hypothetical protein
MRRLLIGLSALALVFPGAAAAGGLYVDAAAPPNDLRAGETWTTKLTFVTCVGQALQDVVPALRLEQQGTGRTLVVVGRRTRQGWIAKVLFPQPARGASAPARATERAPRRTG